MFRFRLDGSSGVPPYLQLVHQVRQSLPPGYLRRVIGCRRSRTSPPTW